MVLLGLCGLFALSACQEGVGVDPVVENFGIGYVQRPLPAMDNSDSRRLSGYDAGGDLYFRDLSAPGVAAKNVTAIITAGEGDVRDVSVSYDGKRLLFALRKADVDGRAAEEQPTWNIWEYNTVSDTLHRIIASDITADAGQDRAPRYLPDGRIVFTSTRQRQARATLLDEGKPQFAALDERRREPAFVLHVMESDGSDIRQLSFNQSHDLDPVVLANGEILFSRWDNMGRQSQISFYKVHPDGTGLEVVYGAHSHLAGANTLQFLRPQVMPDGRLLSLLKPFRSPYGGGNLVTIDVNNYTDSTQLAVNSLLGNITSAQQAATNLDVQQGLAPSLAGRFSAGFPLRDGSNRLLVSWTPCRLQTATRGIQPCTEMALADPAVVEAAPLYGLYLYNRDDATQVPLLVPREGIIYSDIVTAQARPLPDILADQMLDPALAQEGTAILHIRSVYDFDGRFRGLSSGKASIAALADPAQTLADQRPARFLRVIKAVAIPGRNVRRLRGTAFGRSSGQLMREIVAYAPIEPDGSVRIKVPANVPLTISVLDQNGRRISARHQNWLQLRPGETLNCNGCHDHRSGLAHGSSRAPVALNSGAATTGLPFVNTVATFFADMGETMAETRSRLEPASLQPSVDIVYDDVWTDAASAGRAVDASFSYRYSRLRTPVPVSAACQTKWQPSCRIVINYETVIHPLWGLDRGADTCTNCHSSRDVVGNLQVPAAQLDLSDGAAPEQPEHFISYRELLFSDNEQAIVMGALQDRQIAATDANGNPLFVTDANGNPLLDANGQPIPVMVTVPIRPPMSVGGANASRRFFQPFIAGGSHVGRLDAAELRLISEWLDIGAQYYNDPFAVPLP